MTSGTPRRPQQEVCGRGPMIPPVAIVSLAPIPGCLPAVGPRNTLSISCTGGNRALVAISAPQDGVPELDRRATGGGVTATKEERILVFENAHEEEARLLRG